MSEVSAAATFVVIPLHVQSFTTTVTNYVVGHDYMLVYNTGPTLVGTWDGQYFHIRQTAGQDGAISGNVEQASGPDNIVSSPEVEQASAPETCDTTTLPHFESVEELQNSIATFSDDKLKMALETLGIRDPTITDVTRWFFQKRLAITLMAKIQTLNILQGSDTAGVSAVADILGVPNNEVYQTAGQVTLKRPASDLNPYPRKRRRDELFGVSLATKIQQMHSELRQMDESMNGKLAKIRQDLIQMADKVKRVERENLEYRSQVQRLKTERDSLEARLTVQDNVETTQDEDKNTQLVLAQDSLDELYRIKELLRSLQ